MTGLRFQADRLLAISLRTEVCKSYLIKRADSTSENYPAIIADCQVNQGP